MAQEIVVVLIYETILPRPPCSEVSRVDGVAEDCSGSELRGRVGVDLVDDDMISSDFRTAKHAKEAASREIGSYLAWSICERTPFWTGVFMASRRYAINDGWLDVKSYVEAFVANIKEYRKPIEKRLK